MITSKENSDTETASPVVVTDVEETISRLLSITSIYICNISLSLTI